MLGNFVRLNLQQINLQPPSIGSMNFLKAKFFDKENCIDAFLDSGNKLYELEKNPNIPEETKRLFVEQFVRKIVELEIISQEAIQSAPESNPWSIDFPSWIGSFDETKGKRFLIIGAEPHIHFKYLQTVYGFHNEHPVNTYINDHHPIFKYLSALLAHRYQLTKEEALHECYLTDLFPLSPMRGNGLSVGSMDKLQSVIGQKERWEHIRMKYARTNLAKEIEFVKPQLVITQGKQVLGEVLNALDVRDRVKEVYIPAVSGKGQFIRQIEWKNILIISVPHIGSQRMRTFWNSNLEQIKDVFSGI